MQGCATGASSVEPFLPLPDERMVMVDDKVLSYNSDLLHFRKTDNIPTEDTQNPKLHCTECFIYSN
jgi:hypothetical protein